MRIVKGFLIVVAGFFTLITLISLLIPSTVVTVKSVSVHASQEKILAAKRAGIKDVILCVENQKDVEEINKEYIKGVKFHYVRNMTEVLEFALMKK